MINLSVLDLFCPIMSSIEIKCSQSTRPLKRKASQFDPFDDTNDEQTVFKRRNLFSLLPDTIDKWLTELSPFSGRKLSRFDSFLVCAMNNGRQSRSDSTFRPGSVRPAVNKQHAYQPLSPQSLQATSASHTPVTQASASYAQAPQSSYTSMSQQTSQSRTSVASSRKDFKKSKRVQFLSYRDELENHSIFIDSYGMFMLSAILEFARKIIEKEYTSPDLTDQKVIYTRKQLSTLDNVDEEVTRTDFVNTSLFPKKLNYKLRSNKFVIAVDVNLPFDQKALPYTSDSRYSSVVTLMSDFYYDYSQNSFMSSQSRLSEVMQHSRFQSYVKPNSSTYWPFFAVEYKSQSRLEFTWVAKNQNAEIEFHCINSIETLMSYTTNTDEHQIINFIAFSYVVNSHNASLWVHWREDEDDSRFVSSEVDYYHFHRSHDIREFRASVKNIIDYELSERLIMIKNALFDILLQISRWDAENKVTKVRCSSQINIISFLKSFFKLNENLNNDVRDENR